MLQLQYMYNYIRIQLFKFDMFLILLYFLVHAAGTPVHHEEAPCRTNSAPSRWRSPTATEASGSLADLGMSRVNQRLVGDVPSMK